MAKKINYNNADQVKKEVESIGNEQIAAMQSANNDAIKAQEDATRAYKEQSEAINKQMAQADTDRLASFDNLVSGFQKERENRINKDKIDQEKDMRLSRFAQMAEGAAALINLFGTTQGAMSQNVTGQSDKIRAKVDALREKREARNESYKEQMRNLTQARDAIKYGNAKDRMTRESASAKEALASAIDIANKKATASNAIGKLVADNRFNAYKEASGAAARQQAQSNWDTQENRAKKAQDAMNEERAARAEYYRNKAELDSRKQRNITSVTLADKDGNKAPYDIDKTILNGILRNNAQKLIEDGIASGDPTAKQFAGRIDLINNTPLYDAFLQGLLSTSPTVSALVQKEVDKAKSTQTASTATDVTEHSFFNSAE